MNKATKVLSLLSEMHPNARCELDFSTPFELLVAVILSAQCTDKRVNMITKDLFRSLNTPKQFAEVPQEKLEKMIHSCGFYHNKAKNIIGCSKAILERFGGQVPQTVDELVTLDGVGRKTANVVVSVAFGGQAIAVDTHVFRVANRIGLANAKTPDEVEQQLMSAIPKDSWSKSHHLLIFHGRYVCNARKPKCDECAVRDYCDYYADNID